jgi:hypothetical protein
MYTTLKVKASLKVLFLEMGVAMAVDPDPVPDLYPVSTKQK